MLSTTSDSCKQDYLGQNSSVCKNNKQIKNLWGQMKHFYRCRQDQRHSLLNSRIYFKHRQQRYCPIKLSLPYKPFEPFFNVYYRPFYGNHASIYRRSSLDLLAIREIFPGSIMRVSVHVFF